MKVFLAWSGPTSQKLAEFMHGWLPSVVQAIEPFMSAEDIRAGQRWSSEIGARLAEVNFALLCLTPTNLNSQWIHFEAGAVSKNLEQGRVSGLLFDVSATQIQFPLQQFQHTQFSKDDLWKLLQDLNALCAAPLGETQLRKAFDRNFPDVETALADLKDALAQEQKGHAQPSRSTNDILTDVLTAQQGLATKLDAIEKAFGVAFNRDLAPSQATLAAILSKGDWLEHKLAGDALEYLKMLEDTPQNRGDFLAAMEAKYGKRGRVSAAQLLDAMKGKSQA